MNICIVPELPLNLATGGLQVQAVELANSLNNIPFVKAKLFSWSSTDQSADLYHFIGIQPGLYQITQLLNQRNIPYVFTLLASCCSMPSLILASLRQKVGSRLFRNGKIHHQVITNASRIVVLTKADVPRIKLMCGVETTKIEVIPNGINSGFFSPDGNLWRKTFGIDKFLLLVGAIQPRKNQVLAAKVANKLGIPLVVIGPVLTLGHPYNDLFAKEMETNRRFGGHWITNLQNDDPLLHSAYAACHGCILLSAQETQPLSVLQAMAAKKPVLLGDSPYTKSPPFHDLPKVSLDNFDMLCKTMSSFWKHATPTKLSDEFHWDNIANRLSRLYTSILTEAVKPNH